jgi:ribosomal protein L29
VEPNCVRFRSSPWPTLELRLALLRIDCGFRVVGDWLAEMASVVADVSRAAALCAAVPSVSGIAMRAKPRVSVAASPFFSQGVKALSVAPVRSFVTSGALVVVNMAQREEELGTIRKMSDEDINQTVVDLKGELFLLRTKQATRQEFKSSEFRRIRKNVRNMLLSLHSHIILPALL